VFDPEAATTTVTTAAKRTVSVDRDQVDGQEEDDTLYTDVLLRGHATARETMETERIDRVQTRFATG